jgi:hypothetical protein
MMPLEPVLAPLVETLTSFTCAEGSTLDQAVDVTLDCLIQLVDCLPTAVVRAAAVLEDAIPADVHPVSGSVLLQLIIAALYSQLLIAGGNTATALSEALCDLDHSGHSTKIEAFIHAAAQW